MFATFRVAVGKLPQRVGPCGGIWFDYGAEANKHESRSVLGLSLMELIVVRRWSVP